MVHPSARDESCASSRDCARATAVRALRPSNLSLLPLTGMNIVQEPGYSREAIGPRDLSLLVSLSWLCGVAFELRSRRVAPSASINARVTRPYLHRNNYCHAEQDASDPCTVPPASPLPHPSLCLIPDLRATKRILKDSGKSPRGLTPSRLIRD